MVIKEEKATYRQKSESNFVGNNMENVWEDIRLMTEFSASSNAILLPQIDDNFSNEFNSIFNCFHKFDFFLTDPVQPF
ncbi:hypothetical protein HOLleu_43355 [Holothuria leucospilota]|uniref:Uncharacterized protein n=1 Tax=Holothuria leucospilota TaxID=206669 RepID=A0A9Q1B925_HOLLE|nr:hypothetical protein HOLleu_43355 [Holothuria leucospilota]